MLKLLRAKKTAFPANGFDLLLLSIPACRQTGIPLNKLTRKSMNINKLKKMKNKFIVTINGSMRKGVRDQASGRNDQLSPCSGKNNRLSMRKENLSAHTTYLELMWPFIDHYLLFIDKNRVSIELADYFTGYLPCLCRQGISLNKLRVTYSISMHPQMKKKFPVKTGKTGQFAQKAVFISGYDSQGHKTQE